MTEINNELDKEFEALKAETTFVLLMRESLPKFEFNTARGSGSTLMQLSASPFLYICHHHNMVVYARQLCLKHKLKEPRFMVAGGWRDVEQLTRGIIVSYDVDHHAREVFTTSHREWIVAQYEALKKKRRKAEQAEAKLKQEKGKTQE